MLPRWLLPAANVVAQARASQWRGVRFVCYHSVAGEGQLGELSARTLAISAGGFRRHLELIQRNRYTPVSMTQAITLLSTGRARSGQYICLTFDDGRADNFSEAWSLLKSFGYPAHFFVCSDFVGTTFQQNPEDPCMDCEALRTIVREGGSIGSHGRTHPDLTTLDDAALRQQLAGSRAALEDLIKAPVATFAYPYARYDRRVLRLAREAGYLYGFVVTSGIVSKLDSSAVTRRNLTIARNVMRNGADAPENHATLRGGFDFTRPYSALRNTLKSWLS